MNTRDPRNLGTYINSRGDAPQPLQEPGQDDPNRVHDSRDQGAPGPNSWPHFLRDWLDTSAMSAAVLEAQIGYKTGAVTTAYRAVPIHLLDDRIPSLKADDVRQASNDTEKGAP